MQCPFCSHPDTRVIDSREYPDSVRRRRECRACHRRFTTRERVEKAVLTVVKRDGRREDFMREKILAGMRKACYKRPVSDEQIRAAAQEIEYELLQRGDSEVTSEEIGRMVLQRLRELDEVAFLRFATVYKPYRDVSEVVDDIEQLRQRRSRTPETEGQLKLPL
jgi:transcriptional repressor NrdR